MADQPHRRADGDGGAIARITGVRSEYTSARVILANLEQRAAGRRRDRAPGYLPSRVDYVTRAGRAVTISVRDYDVRYLDRVADEAALRHLTLIHDAREGDTAAAATLQRLTADLLTRTAPRFAAGALVEDDCVVPYTSTRVLDEEQASDKGAVLLNLTRLGFATPDFNLLTASAYDVDEGRQRQCIRDGIGNLERLSGRRFGDPDNPLLIAMRSALPRYLPGFMPTYLNVGLTPAMLPGLPRRYGADAVARIRLNSRRTILETLDPAAYADVEPDIRADLDRDRNHALADRLEALIAARDGRLLDDPYHQVAFFLDAAYRYYDANLEALRNFMGNRQHRPTMILQRMVCSVIDRESYAGVLFSRHPGLGRGVYLQYARAIYGEDLMTGRLAPLEVHFREREEARERFPAIHHFWPRLAQLEQVFGGPVMVEFTGVHGTFTILQVNHAELTGPGMLTAAIDMHRDQAVGSARVRELVAPYHLRQVESDTLDPASLDALEPFSRGLSVLPHSAVCGRLRFSTDGLDSSRRDAGGEPVILVRERFTPTDVVLMQQVAGICSLSPAAIHVVTTAQTLGIPALLDLERAGVGFGADGRSLINRDGLALREGDWVTISSRRKTLYRGKAVFATARLLRYIAGEDVTIEPHEQERFDQLADSYREFRRILDETAGDGFESLQELGQSARSGRLSSDPQRAAAAANRLWDTRGDDVAEHLLDTPLGMHLNNRTAFALLTVERRAALLTVALRLAASRQRRGYAAGAFVLGCLVAPDAAPALWRGLEPDVTARLLDEWVLHQKYQELLAEVGERRINAARGKLLTGGLGALRVHAGLARQFMPLKLSGVDLAAVRAALPAAAEPETAALLDLLTAPWCTLVDFDRPMDVARLERLCAGLGVPTPGPDSV
jgi:hypothetical protein